MRPRDPGKCGMQTMELSGSNQRFVPFIVAITLLNNGFLELSEDYFILTTHDTAGGELNNFNQR
jgi:hypothetical protein